MSKRDFCKMCGYVESVHPRGDHEYESEWKPRIRVSPLSPQTGAARGRAAFTTEDPGDYSIWVEIPDDKWTTAYRLMAAGPTLKVAEVRMYPTDAPDDIERLGPGEWSHEPTLVQEAGVTARLLRTIRVQEHKEHAVEILERLRDQMGEDGYNTWLAQHGVVAPEVVSALVKKPGGGSRARKLASTAARYVDLLQSGVKNPVTVISREEDVSATVIRDRIKDARLARLLTKAPSRGVAGGALTEKAEDLLKGEGIE